jgi:hypothetical protein
MVDDPKQEPSESEHAQGTLARLGVDRSRFKPRKAKMPWVRIERRGGKLYVRGSSEGRTWT